MDVRRVMLLFMTLLLMTGCFSSGDIKKEPIELTAREVVEKLQSTKQNSFLLYLRAENCYSCDEYEKVVQEIEEKEPFEIYYLTVHLDEETDDVKKALQELDVTIGSYSELPVTYYFYQGALLPENKKEGFIEKEVLEEWLTNLHILH